MNKVCDFTAQSGSGAHKLTQLAYENECLRQEVTELKSELSSISDKTNSQSESISSLQSKIDEIKESYSANLTQHTEQVTQQIEHQMELFDAAVGLYENWSIGFSLLLALGSVISFCFISVYKRGQIKEVVDNAVDELHKQTQNEDLLISAVVNAFDHERLEQKIESIRSDMFDRQEVLVRTMLEDRIGSEESESFRDTFRADGATGEKLL